MPHTRLQTPVVMLIFNRPEYTSQVFARIAKARPKQLIVVADGPRPDQPNDIRLCTEARRATEDMCWPCEVARLYRDRNLGLVQGVGGGITWAFEQVDRAIILEDDCVPDLSFFGYCETLLARYEKDDRIAMISGTNPLDSVDIPESYFFARFYSIWGWATWRRAWRHYQPDMSGWSDTQQIRRLRKLYASPVLARHVADSFNRTVTGRLNSWDIYWLYTCLFQNRLCAIPKASLIKNIGAVGANAIANMRNKRVNGPVSSIDPDSLIHPEVLVTDRFDRQLGRKVRITPVERVQQKLTIMWNQWRSDRQTK